MKNIVIWFIGSNSSGKTTQAKLLHKQFQTQQPKVVEFQFLDVTSCYTDFGLIANLGRVSENQCTGTDTLNKKIQIETAFNKLVELDTRVIIVDGILATNQWSKFIFEPSNYHKLLFLLDFNTVEENIARVRQRRFNKNGSTTINDKTHQNLQLKINGFRSLYKKASLKADSSKIIDANMPISVINQIIIDSIAQFYE